MTQNCKSLRDRDPLLLEKATTDKELLRLTFTPLGKKVTQYERKLTSRHPTPGARKTYHGRSANLIWGKIEKDYDFQLYHTKANDVFLYRDNPNRENTPIQIKRPSTSNVRIRQWVPTGLSEQKIRDMLKAPDIPVSQSLRQTVLGQLLHEKLPPLPLASSPRITIHHPGLKRHIINDYHSLETNSGYARNSYGGFYLH